MSLPLDSGLTFGVEALHRPKLTGDGVWLPSLDDLFANVELIDRCGYDSIWVGDHLSFIVPMLDPLLMIAQAAAISRRLTFGVGVHLLPLRHPAPVAKQVATLDHLTEGRLIFGVGVGGEFPKEYELAGVPVTERGARLTESIEVLRKLWSGETVTHKGRFFQFEDVAMQPPPRQAGGPPIWCGGRSDAALRRAGRQADGWIAYVVTPEMYGAAMQKIADAAEEAGRTLTSFSTAHLLFVRLDESYEKALDIASDALSVRYGMDFRKATERYGAVGTPQQVADTIAGFHEAGVRHIEAVFVGPYDDFDGQLQRFAGEVIPLLKKLRAA